MPDNSHWISVVRSCTGRKIKTNEMCLLSKKEWTICNREKRKKWIQLTREENLNKKIPKQTAKNEKTKTSLRIQEIKKNIDEMIWAWLCKGHLKRKIELQWISSPE